ncbi:hypothetical protein DIPPA_30510 [Diplonema papillatum]|nr:hypothetical protein DIPPA_30510 [Diplonema papillatum]
MLSVRTNLALPGAVPTRCGAYATNNCGAATDNCGAENRSTKQCSVHYRTACTCNRTADDNLLRRSRIRAATRCTNYSPSEETPQQVIARHKAYLGREGLHSSNVLPYLYGTLKLHKEVTSMRYIAGVSRKNCVDSDSEAADAGRDARPKTTFSSTTDAQLDLTGLLKAIMSILRREDDIRFNATGYRYFWITESSDDTAFFLKTHADELAQLDAGTFDFTTMYDQLELEELLNAVADTINEAFAAEAARLNVDAGRLPKDPPELRCKRCFTDRTKDGRLFRGLRGLRVHERLCTYVNFGE